MWGINVRSLVVILAVTVTAFLPASVAYAQELRVLFFDPDANLQSIEEITTAFQGFLTDVDNRLIFQPINDQGTFDAQLGEGDVGFVIVSSALLRDHPVIQPLLVPARAGSPHYTKLLLQRAGALPGDLQGKSIAGTAFASSDTPEGTKRILTELASNNKLKLKGATIIPVSKDIDALLALVFGQVHGALVTRATLAALDATIPGGRAKIQEVYESPRILRSPLGVIAENVSPRLRRNMHAAFLAMADTEKGKSVLSLLGYDSWQPIPPRAFSP